MTATKHPVPKICQHCHRPFVARKYITKFCSLRCAQKAYKENQRNERLAANAKSEQGGHAPKRHRTEKLVEHAPPLSASSLHQREIIDVTQLSQLTGVSKRTIYRLMKSAGFPYLRIGKLLRFHKATTISFITEKFASYERNIEKEKDSKGKKG